jgi:hypothetical protein
MIELVEGRGEFILARYSHGVYAVDNDIYFTIHEGGVSMFSIIDSGGIIELDEKGCLIISPECDCE